MPLLPPLLARHARPVFVETGTARGDTVAMALEAGAERAISIEFDAGLAAQSRERFAGDPRVTVLHGDSGQLLAEVLMEIHEPALVWLDAHETLGPARPSGQSPILHELRGLLDVPCREHTVLIDDMGCYRAGEEFWHFDSQTGDVVRDAAIEGILRAVNPSYKLTYEDAYKPREVLVACL